MKFMTLSGFVSSWLIVAPAIWVHRPAKAILAGVIGLFVMLLSPIGAFWAPARMAVAAAGGILALSNFVLADSIGTLANHCTVGLLFLFAGLAPEVKTQVAEANEALPIEAPGAEPSMSPPEGISESRSLAA